MVGLVFLTFCNFHTLISNSEKLTHPRAHPPSLHMRQLHADLSQGNICHCWDVQFSVVVPVDPDLVFFSPDSTVTQMLLHVTCH